jgi:acylphosphatase
LTNKRVHIIVSGIVQGVFFRANTLQEANQLGIYGWVRNLNDGRVEIMAEGESSLIEKMVSWCKVGPPGAQINRIDIKYLIFRDEFVDFRIIR